MRAFQVSKIGEPAELSQVTAPNAACSEWQNILTAYRMLNVAEA